jgi:NitT/TauT family transport system substrate-binding protein
VTRIRLSRQPAVCFAPTYVAEELLRLEGFTDVEYVRTEKDGSIGTLTSGASDLSMMGVSAAMLPLDRDEPITILAGIHAGCWELMASDRVRSVRELKGKSIAVIRLRELDHVFISSILAWVGMDPHTDVRWVETQRMSESMRLFVEGQVDAFLGFAQQPLQVRAMRVGRTLINTTHDRPWSQYFCCLAAARRDFTRQYPVATKRALRALLKAADLCAQDPDGAARLMEARGIFPDHELGREVIRSLPYDRWRTDDPEDSLRFLALRLREVGMIRSTPQGLIERGTDWRFLNELKKELKA